MTRIRIARLLGLFLSISLVLTACGGQKASDSQQAPAAEQPSSGSQQTQTKPQTQQPAPTPVKLSIVTGGTSGVYYVYGGGLAKLLSDKLPGVTATAEVSAASVENMNLLNQKSADIAFSLSDTAADAVNGKGKFTEKLPLKAIATLYGNMTHIVALADSPINSVQDLKGKKVSTGSPNSGTEVIAERILRAAGVDPEKDITRERLGVGESATALKDKKIDAFFWSGGLPTAGVLELASSPGVKIKLISHDDLVPTLINEYGNFYVVNTVAANTYPNTPEAKISAVWNILVVRADMDEDLVYNILKTMFDNTADLVAVHTEAKNLNLKSAATNSPIDYHPGAIKFYKEKGVWTGN